MVKNRWMFNPKAFVARPAVQKLKALLGSDDGLMRDLRMDFSRVVALFVDDRIMT